MGAYPELAIFRRFGALNLRNIMFMQAEIADLEKKYETVVAEDDRAGDPERAALARGWRDVARTGAMDDASPRYRIVRPLRELLRDYSQ